MGTRMGSRRKNYLKLLGIPVLAHTLAAFESAKNVESVILVAPAADMEFCRKNIVEKYRLKKVLKIIAGGKERQDSVARGLAAIEITPDIILVHDGARPLVTPELIEAVIKAAADYGGAAAAVPVKDTIKETRGAFIKKTVPREKIWAVQTPQAFRTALLIKARAAAVKSGFTGTDESSLVERLNKKVALVPGLYENIKITTPEDLIAAKAFFEKRMGRGKRGK
ncbi:MAG: 2-C-methyl-D-erythritol 4-phosphate cytidylyltransferase [Deltaproteobacteria bacterium]|nr:2-C-methyl-D-erythritol 4-phosphate cytidylyltransferase [Deltaproteobacteria bacterium]